MKKSIQSVFLAFVVLTVLLSGCAPASTPVPPTFTPLPTNTPIPPTFTSTPTLVPSPTVTPIFPPIENFVGTWLNVDTNTRDWTKIEITSEGGTLTAHIWGSCSPTDCDAGSTSAIYNGNPVPMILDHGFVIRNFTFSLNGDTLHVTTFNHYTDNSGRTDRTDEDDFRK